LYNKNNKNIEEIKDELERNNIDVVIIGNGNKIIKQYPNKNTEVINGDKVFLVTNGNENKMHNISDWSKYDVSKYCELSKISCTYNGNGYVKNQSISKGTVLNKESKLEVEFDIREIE